MRTLLWMLLLAALGIAQTTPNAQSLEKPWISLFNGKDLTGWVQMGSDNWGVDSGTLHGQGTTKEGSLLRTDTKYKSFHLFLRYKCEAAGNYGVFFHTDFTAATGRSSQTKQFEIDPVIGKHTGGVYARGRGWIVWPAAENETVVKPYDWNDLLVSVEGNRYISRLNGVLMVDYTDPTTMTVPVRPPESWDGYIALQLHAPNEAAAQGKIRFKDIYIRDLSER